MLQWKRGNRSVVRHTLVGRFPEAWPVWSSDDPGMRLFAHEDWPVMHQRVRCAHCHSWTDSLLVWAAGDCCPNCNESMTVQLSRASDELLEKPLRREPSRFSQPPPSRMPQSGSGQLSERR